MKKLLSFLLCVAMCFALAACGKNPSADSSVAATPSGSAAESNSTPEAPSSEPDDGDAMTLETYIDSIKDQIDGMTASMEEAGMNLDVLARENSLVYSYQFTEDVGDTSLLKDSLEQSLEELSSSFESILSALKQAVSSAESVVVEYLDKDGNVIVSKEYK